jgi:hypothetical protein
MRKLIAVALLMVMMVACLSAPAMGMAQVVDDQLPNIHPWFAVSMIEQKTGILPEYNITGQECYDLFVKVGRDMHFVSLRKGNVFPVYNVSDIDIIYRVKYPETDYPVLLGVLGGTFTADKEVSECFQIVAGKDGPEVYSWKP